MTCLRPHKYVTTGGAENPEIWCEHVIFSPRHSGALLSPRPLLPKNKTPFFKESSTLTLRNERVS